MTQLERETIICRDRDQKIKSLDEEIEVRDDKIRDLDQQLETSRCELANCQKQVADLQEKFMQSSSHVMEETVR